MGATSGNKWYVHCPVCGAYLIRSSVSDSEVECKKCHNTIGVLVKDGMVRKPGGRAHLHSGQEVSC